VRLRLEVLQGPQDIIFHKSFLPMQCEGNRNVFYFVLFYFLQTAKYQGTYLRLPYLHIVICEGRIRSGTHTACIGTYKTSHCGLPKDLDGKCSIVQFNLVSKAWNCRFLSTTVERCQVPNELKVATFYLK